jgi:glycine hydroxymethyltransferase
MRPVAGGTDTHLVLADLRELGVTGRDAEARCEHAGMTLNKNALPYDPEPPTVASGIRVGSPGVTTQGMREGEMRTIAEFIGAAVRAQPGTAAGAEALRELVVQTRELAQRFPAYERQEVFA